MAWRRHEQIITVVHELKFNKHRHPGPNCYARTVQAYNTM